MAEDWIYSASKVSRDMRLCLKLGQVSLRSKGRLTQEPAPLHPFLERKPLYSRINDLMFSFQICLNIFWSALSCVVWHWSLSAFVCWVYWPQRWLKSFEWMPMKILYNRRKDMVLLRAALCAAEGQTLLHQQLKLWELHTTHVAPTSMLLRKTTLSLQSPHHIQLKLS